MTTINPKVGQNYTYTDSNKPDTAFGGVNPGFVKSGDEYSWVQIPLGAAADAVRLTTAELRIPLAADITSGTRTFTARRPDDDWRPRHLTDNNKPGVTGASSVTGTIGAEDAGYLLVFDIKTDTQAFLDAGLRSHPGWRIQTTDATRRKLDLAAAELHLVFHKAGTAPTGLVPNDNLVSVSKFLVGWQSNLDQVEHQVQVGASGFSSPTLDTDWFAVDPDTFHVLDLATTSYGGLSSGTTYWRVRSRNAGGVETPWSSEALVTRATKPPVTIVSPTSVVLDSTPPHDIDMTGMIGMTVAVDDLTTGKRVLTQGFTTTTGVFTPDKPLYKHPDHEYQLRVVAWDGQDWSRLEAPNAAVLLITADLDEDTPAVVSMSVTQPGLDPWVDIEWTTGGTEDGGRVFRDGDDISGTLDSLDVLVAGNTYRWRCYTSRPGVTHIYSVKAVEDGHTAKHGPVVQHTMSAVGTWLVHPDTERRFCLHGEGAAAILTPTGEDEATETRIGDTILRRVTSIVGPVTGPVLGVLSQRSSGRAWDAQEADLWEMRSMPPSTAFRLIQGVTNAPVTVGSLIAYDIESSIPPHNTRRGARFTVAQDGELPFTRPVRG